MLPRADDCTSLTCKANRVALVKEIKQILEHVSGLEEQLFEHIATTEEHWDLIKELRDSYDRLHKPPNLEDIADMAEAMRKDILLGIQNPNIDRDGLQVTFGSRDGSSTQIEDPFDQVADMDIQAEMVRSILHQLNQGRMWEPTFPLPDCPQDCMIEQKQVCGESAGCGVGEIRDRCGVSASAG